jgi:putative spermidine/putrescine transport system ATP-binding protein
LKIRGVGRREREARVAELVDLTGIGGLENRRIDQISGGQRQRVALARAVATRPRVLLLDEPLTALDASLRERLRGELDKLLRSVGITTVYVTHDQAEAMALGDRIVVMRAGAIVQIGAPREIYFEPANRFVAEFIGAANIVEGDAAGAAIAVAGGRLPISDATATGKVIAMIRPERIAIVPLAEAHICGRVEAVRFVGDRQRLTVVDATERPLVIDAANTAAVKAGDRIGLCVDPAAVRLLVDGQTA